MKVQAAEAEGTPPPAAFPGPGNGLSLFLDVRLHQGKDARGRLDQLEAVIELVVDGEVGNAAGDRVVWRRDPCRHLQGVVFAVRAAVTAAEQLDEVGDVFGLDRPHSPVQHHQRPAFAGESLHRRQTGGVVAQPLGPLRNEEHQAVGRIQQGRTLAPGFVGRNHDRLQVRELLQAVSQDPHPGQEFVGPGRMAVRPLADQQQALFPGSGRLLGPTTGRCSHRQQNRQQVEWNS